MEEVRFSTEQDDPPNQSTHVLEEEPGFQYAFHNCNPFIVLFLFLGLLTVTGACVAIFYAVFEHFWTYADVSRELPTTATPRSKLAHVAMQKVSNADSHRTVFCFINHNPTSGSPYRFYAENVSTTLCDAAVYTSVGIDSSGTGIRSKNPDIDFTARGLKRFTGLKKAARSGFTIWLCVGGTEEDSQQFKIMVCSRQTRLAFIHNTIAWTKEQGFDGVVIYWRYPSVEARSNFSTLLITLQSLFHRQNLTVSIVVPWNHITRRNGYYSRSIYSRFKYVIVDSHRTVDPYMFAVTTCQSPMRSVIRARHHGQPGLTAILDDLSMETDHLLNRTVLSVSLRGLSFTVWRPRTHRVGMSALGPGRPMGYTNRVGTVSYYDVAETLLKNASWTRFLHGFSSCAVAICGDQWVGFEDRDSIRAKKPLVMRTSGIAIWDLEMDDFAGGLGPTWPLLMEAHDIVHGQGKLASTANSSCDTVVDCYTAR